MVRYCPNDSAKVFFVMAWLALKNCLLTTDFLKCAFRNDCTIPLRFIACKSILFKSMHQTQITADKKPQHRSIFLKIEFYFIFSEVIEFFL